MKKFALGILLLAAGLVGQARSQSVGCANWNGNAGAVTTVSSTSCTTSSAGTSTFVLVVINAPAATSVPTITDTFGNNAKWTLAQSINTYPGQPRTLALYYCNLCTGGSGYTATATWTGTGDASIGFVEFQSAGTLTLGVAPTGVTDTAASPIVAPSITTTQANQLVINAFGTYSSNTQTLANNATGGSGGFTAAVSQQSVNTYQNGMISYQIVTSSGTAVKDAYSYSTFDYTAALAMSLKTPATNAPPAGVFVTLP
jgi:hypothetical protein